MSKSTSTLLFLALVVHARAVDLTGESGSSGSEPGVISSGSEPAVVGDGFTCTTPESGTVNEVWCLVGGKAKVEALLADECPGLPALGGSCGNRAEWVKNKGDTEAPEKYDVCQFRDALADTGAPSKLYTWCGLMETPDRTLKGFRWVRRDVAVAVADELAGDAMAGFEKTHKMS